MKKFYLGLLHADMEEKSEFQTALGRLIYEAWETIVQMIYLY